MSQGVLSVVKSGKESEWEWKINNFSLSEFSYSSPYFTLEGESWCMRLYPNCTGYMDLRLRRSSNGSPIEVEFSVSVKTTKGRKSFERRERKCFEGKDSRYDIDEWINRSEFRNRQKEFLSSGCLTILITMQKVEYEKETSSASAAAFSSGSKDCHQGDKISLDRKFLSKLVKCAECDEVVSLNNWFNHECQISNAKVASVAEVCSCCKESRHGGSLQKIPVHKKCLDQPIMCPKCAQIVSLQKWFDHECQAANVKSECGAFKSSGPHPRDKIVQDFKKLFFNQENCDVVLKVQGQEFSAHQAILTARSPVFASTFRCNMKEKETGTVDIEDIDPSCFPEFLCFLYCGEIDKLSAENVRSLFSAADKYQILDLRAICLEFMKTKLCVDTFCETLELALLHTETELVNSCTEYFVQNAEEIIETVQWQNFNAENPTQGNELFIKYVKSTKKLNK